MSKQEYIKLVAEYRRKDKLYPDRGFSIRPWEQPLRERIQEQIDAGREAGKQWVIAVQDWIEK